MYLVTGPAGTEEALAQGKYFKGQIWSWAFHGMLLSLWHAPESFRLRCPGASWHLYQSKLSPYFSSCNNACLLLSPTPCMSHAVVYTGHCVTHAVSFQSAAVKDRGKEAILTREKLQKTLNSELWDLFALGLIGSRKLELVSLGSKDLTCLNGKQTRLPLPHTVQLKLQALSILSLVFGAACLDASNKN